MQNIIWGERVFFKDKMGYSDYVSMARGLPYMRKYIFLKIGI